MESISVLNAFSLFINSLIDVAVPWNIDLTKQTKTKKMKNSKTTTTQNIAKTKMHKNVYKQYWQKPKKQQQHNWTRNKNYKCTTK